MDQHNHSVEHKTQREELGNTATMSQSSILHYQENILTLTLDYNSRKSSSELEKYRKDFSENLNL